LRHIFLLFCCCAAVGGVDASGFVASVNDVCQLVVGAPNADVSKFASDDTWPGGMPVFLDKTTGLASSSGTVFAGVTVADGGTGKAITAARTGTVPVRARSHFTIHVTADSVLSNIAATILACGGDAGTHTTDGDFDLAMAIKPGMMLYSIPSLGHNYVTPFDLYSIFHALVADILADIQSAIAGAFVITVPTLPAPTVEGGSLTVPTASVFPSLSITFPALTFGSFDPCLPLSSGAQDAVDTFDGYDFTSAFAAVQDLITAFDPSFAASLSLPNTHAIRPRTKPGVMYKTKWPSHNICCPCLP